MCGIAGGTWLETPRQLESKVGNALKAMAHRGPNDQGFEIHRAGSSATVLSQTRLSVIDVSSGGHQPMLTADGRFVMVFNGEIYNYLELRSELQGLGHEFHTRSDGEVLLKAWVQWGQDCLLRLTGMFALVIHDRSENTLTCVRDAFGIKPLFYILEQGRLVFASELPALLAYEGGRLQPDWQRGYDYLVHGEYDSNDRTFVEGVRQLRPGCLLRFNTRTGQVEETSQWWRAPIAQTSKLSFADAAEAVREQFLQNVRLHLRSDVPLGAALSGGVDSSAVVCAMRILEPDAPIQTFSYIAEGGRSEEAWVDLVNAHVGANGHKVALSPGELARDLDTLIRTQGEPFGSTSIYAQYRVYQLAREQGITVTLDGQGADELLGGYFAYAGVRMRSLAETAGPQAMFEFASRRARIQGLPYADAWLHYARTILPDDVNSQVRKWMGRDAAPAWLNVGALRDAGVNLVEPRRPHRADAKGRRLVEMLAHSLQVRGLPHLLRHGDRNSMAFSIESRVPFLTREMAELLLSLPEDYLISGDGETKSVFRAAMRGIVPDAILDRKDKIGFETPEGSWFSSLAEVCQTWLQDADQIPFLRREPLLAAFDAMIRNTQLPSRHAWRLINYVRWHATVLS